MDLSRKLMKDGWISCGEKKDERERRERERERYGGMRKKGRNPSLNPVQRAPGRRDLAAWAPAHLKLILLLLRS